MLIKQDEIIGIYCKLAINSDCHYGAICIGSIHKPPPAGLRRGPPYDDEVVFSGNESQTTPRSVDLIHAVDEGFFACHNCLSFKALLALFGMTKYALLSGTRKSYCKKYPILDQFCRAYKMFSSMRNGITPT